MNLALVGEAWGEEEDKQKTPFVGPSGYHLTLMLEEAGIHRADCFLTNVFNLRPDSKNDITALCGTKAESIPGYPALVKGKYVRAEFASELDRLGDELIEHNPNLIVALGNTPLWALTAKSGISKLRGYTCLSTHTAAGFKLLPTYHPAAMLYKGQWKIRPIIVADLMKAFREREFPEIRRPERQIWIEPTLEDIYAYRDLCTNAAGTVSVDIETSGNQITCIGFSYDPSIAIVIPFRDTRKKGRSYWSTAKDELSAWLCVRGILEDRYISKLFQNGLYDIAFLWRAYGIRAFSAEHDTMLLHHALHPESLKGLEFLGSIYSDEGAWKRLTKHETIKRDD